MHSAVNENRRDNAEKCVEIGGGKRERIKL